MDGMGREAGKNAPGDIYDRYRAHSRGTAEDTDAERQYRKGH